LNDERCLWLDAIESTLTLMHQRQDVAVISHALCQQTPLEARTQRIRFSPVRRSHNSALLTLLLAHRNSQPADPLQQSTAFPPGGTQVPSTVKCIPACTFISQHPAHLCSAKTATCNRKYCRDRPFAGGCLCLGAKPAMDIVEM